MAVLSSQNVRASASISITANGTSRVNGTLTWTPPPAPVSEITLVSIAVACDSYTWSGKGNFTLTINGTTCASGVPFNVKLPLNVTSPYTITGVGGNKNTTGANCTFTNLMVIYTYQIEGDEVLMVKVNGIWNEVQSVYKKVNGVWVEQDDLQSVFDENVKYVKG